jgi:HK97 family phage prohead protease
MLQRDQFEGYASLFGVADNSGDVVARGAFTRSLRDISRIRMLYQHVASEPIGVWEEMREDETGLYVRGRIVMDTERGRDVLALMREGALDGLSISFRTQRARKNRVTGQRTLLEVELWEVSVVTFPLLKGSHVTAIGKKNEVAREIHKAARALELSSHARAGEVARANAVRA